MKNIVSLLALATVSVLSTSNLLADTLNPGITASLTAVGSSNTLVLTELPGSYSFFDGTSLITAAVVSTPLASVVNVTDVCISINTAFCKKYSFSITDANFAGVSLQAGVSAYALAQTSIASNVATVNLDGSVALGTDALVFSGSPMATPPSASPVPEPGTISLMATGLLGAAGAVRRRFRA